MAPPLPLHVIHVPSATHRWQRWPALVEQGLAVEESAVTPADFDIKQMAGDGSIGLLAAWRIASNLVPVDRCVLTGNAQIACGLSHLKLMIKQVQSGDPVWATCEDDVDPSLDVINGLPLLVRAMDQLDPDWDMVSLASWCIFEAPPSEDGTEQFTAVDVPGVGAVRLARIRFMEGTGAQLVSRRGALKLIPILSHVDTHVDKAFALASDLGLLRLYNATKETPEGREAYVPLGIESTSSTLQHNQHSDGKGASAMDLPVLWAPDGTTKVLAVALGVVGVIAVALLGMVIYLAFAGRGTNQRGSSSASSRYPVGGRR